MHFISSFKAVVSHLKMRIALVVLGWPKGLFGCFHNVVWKTRKNFWPTQYLTHISIDQVVAVSVRTPVQCIAQGQQSIDLSIIVKIRECRDLKISLIRNLIVLLKIKMMDKLIIISYTVL